MPEASRTGQPRAPTITSWIVIGPPQSVRKLLCPDPTCMMHASHVAENLEIVAVNERSVDFQLLRHWNTCYSFAQARAEEGREED